MGIHKCRYCKTHVSPRAKACPHCGEPNPGGAGVGTAATILRMFFILMVFGMLFMFVFDGLVFDIKPSIYLFAMLAAVFMIRQLARD